jgi:tRNA(Ile)-lysidine synthase
MRILDRVAAVIRTHKLLNQKDSVIAAVSGGADSLALLHILANLELELKLTAVYVDHGLRPLETPHEQQTIADSCRALKIPFAVRTVDVRQLVAQEKKSPEEAARILRYRALEEFRQQCGAKLIAVGHTADDQVEEFFIRLLRGSSSRGLAGMRLKRDNIVRPLLFAKKAHLAGFLSERGIAWCLDSSNLDRQFLRNRVRLDLLPLLEAKFNPALRTTILRNMDVLAEEDNLLNDQTVAAYRQCVECTDVSTMSRIPAQLFIRRENFLASHPAIRRRILEKSCWQMAIRPTYEQIRTLVEYMESGKTGGELHLEDGVRVEKSPDGLRLIRPLPPGVPRGSRPPAPVIRQVIPGPGSYMVFEADKELVLEESGVIAARQPTGDQLLVDRAKISFPLLLRSFLPGEKFFPCGGRGGKKIARYFNEQKIPAKERPAWPVLLSADKVIALVGLQLDDAFRVTAGTSTILSIRWRDRKR